MADITDEFQLEEIANLHGIASALFVPFAIARSQHSPGDTHAVWTVLVRDKNNAAEQQRTLRLDWSADSASMLPFGVQENTVTEWAALGMACVLIWQFARVRLHTVAGPGDSFDFWAADETGTYGVEVSGTMTGDLEQRHQAKVQQLLENPYGIGGYVIVVDFAKQTAIISFHRGAEGIG